MKPPRQVGCEAYEKLTVVEKLVVSILCPILRIVSSFPFLVLYKRPPARAVGAALPLARGEAPVRGAAFAGRGGGAAQVGGGQEEGDGLGLGSQYVTEEEGVEVEE